MKTIRALILVYLNAEYAKSFLQKLILRQLSFIIIVIIIIIIIRLRKLKVL